jgi:hypothetical protein
MKSSGTPFGFPHSSQYIVCRKSSASMPLARGVHSG